MIERFTFGAEPHLAGPFIKYQNFACEEWRPGTDTPDRLDSLAAQRWRIMLDYGGKNQQIGYYWDGAFRYANGSNVRKPERWAYLRLTEDVWTVTKPVTKPGVHIDAVAGQQLIDILKRSFTTTQIQDFMDASPFDEPDTGAPETPGAMG